MDATFTFKILVLLALKDRTPITDNLRPKKHEGLVFVLPKTLPFKTAVRFERVAADPTCRGSVQVFQCKRLR